MRKFFFGLVMCFIAEFVCASNGNSVCNESGTLVINSFDNDVDDMLSSYEKNVDSYIAIMKKVKAGDTSAMSEYAKLLKQSQDLQKKIENVKSDMTTAQIAKYTKITNKLNEALLSL